MNPPDFIIALRKGKRAPAYFLRGPDRFLHEMCREALVNSVPPEAREWCLDQIEFEPGRLAQELRGTHQMPMLGGHSYFLISDPEDFKHSTDEDYEALEAYLDRPSSFATVVFAAVEPDRRRRLIQLLEKKATVVEMRPLALREAVPWVVDYLGRAGVEIAPELAEEIASKFESTDDREPERAGVNLLRLRTELEKLLTAKRGAKRLERPDLELMVEFREERQISTFLRALAERNCTKALERLRSLLANKTAETLLLWCIADFLRQALKQSAAVPHGAGRGGWSRPGSFSATWEIAAGALRKYSRQELLRGLKLTRRTDLGIKSSWKDSRILLEFLVWQIVVGKGSEGVPARVEEIPSLSVEA
jgi:DNA polymerase III delta subunit